MRVQLAQDVKLALSRLDPILQLQVTELIENLAVLGSMNPAALASGVQRDTIGTYRAPCGPVTVVFDVNIVAPNTLRVLQLVETG